MVAGRSPVNVAAIALVIIVALVWTLSPLYYLFLTSVKSIRTIMERPPRFIVWPSFESYQYILFKEQFYQFFVNSFVIAFGATLLALVLGGTAAFAFSHWTFRGKEPLFLSSLVGRMFPLFTAQSLLVPVNLGAREGSAACLCPSEDSVAAYPFSLFERAVPRCISRRGR